MISTPAGHAANDTKAQIGTVNLGTAGHTLHSRPKITGIDKRPTDGPVDIFAPGRKGVAGSGVTGDTVCDLRHHGGNDQAVYAYAREDLDRWQQELGRPLTNGVFGENLTTVGYDISSAIIGERWAVGAELVLEISDPRIPCRTFAGWLGEKGWVKRFTVAAIPGTYLRVIKPGPAQAGDILTVIHRPDHGVPVATAFRAFTAEPELLELLVGIESLSAEAKRTVARRIPARA